MTGEGLKRARAAAWASQHPGSVFPSPEGIADLLTFTGLIRAGKTRPDGAGFKIGRFGTLGGVVTVRHHPPGAEDTDAMLAEYAAVIEAAGYKARRDDRVARLIVTHCP